MSARPRIDDAQRRARLQRRHLLTDDVPQAFSVTDAVSSIVGLHATCPPTMYLSLWARLPGFVREQLDSALYDERSLVKQLAMRRTMFVLDRAGLADAVGAVGPRVAASERTNMLRDLRRSNDFDDPEGWIDTARAAVVDALADGSVASSTELRKRLPELDGHVQIAPDRSWGGTAPMGPRVLNMMSAAGDIVRGPNAAGWHLSRPQWSSMQRWLGEPLPQLSVAEGHRAMVARWLRTFGPGTETDIVWWLGSTKASVRAALADLAAVEVDLDGGGVGYVLPDDLDDVEPVAPRGFLLPELDPATMGWKDRGWYLGDHGEHMFDRNGNGGQTIWWDGRIVGGWFHRPDGSVGLHPLEKLPRAATTELSARADELSAWLGDARPKPGYPAPFMKAVR
ncbi:winged helix DNA-binding domain-containing protein [Williamsia herbipolensis]|uniref:Winged helix DNA-binding domain-containing protein n=1 Tax=Williamsia herbipolensis TaxID=1603258 RepID=A0AAU4K091_9NOCA|nr:winged helix DNA-binding domain-containing protein [Williamsia herbipolensis]